MDNKEDKVIIEERIPVGVVTMLLTGYLEANKRLTYALIVAIVALLCSWGGFLFYLSQYEVNVSNYGTVENSKINADKGIFEQQAQTITNNGVKIKDENQK